MSEQDREIRERREAVETIIRCAARWGWTQAQDLPMNAAFPEPIIEWSADNRPTIL